MNFLQTTTTSLQCFERKNHRIRLRRLWAIQRQTVNSSLVQVRSSAVAGVSDGRGIATIGDSSVGVSAIDSAPVEARVGVGASDVLGRSHSDEGKANEELQKHKNYQTQNKSCEILTSLYMLRDTWLTAADWCLSLSRWWFYTRTAGRSVIRWSKKKQSRFGKLAA